LDRYLKPKFPIVKSNLVHGEEPWNLFEMRSLPALLCVLQACGSYTFPCYVSFSAFLINCFKTYSLSIDKSPTIYHNCLRRLEHHKLSNVCIGIEQLNALPFSNIPLCTDFEVVLFVIALYIIVKNINMQCWF
jgi:hypothetical protein